MSAQSSVLHLKLLRIITTRFAPRVSSSGKVHCKIQAGSRRNSEFCE
jgi:hypothetical protein